jgi:mannitol/fructose-specific phosphotransferase system IIA component (Ntr-type)
VALAERMLSHAVAYASGVDVPVTPLTRVDHNFANGIARGVAETRSSVLIIGWDARRSARNLIFGTVLDQLLEQTRQQVIVAKLGHPLNTTRRILLLVPRGSDRIPGFLEAARAIKRMANRLGAQIVGHVVAGPPEVYRRHFSAIKPDAPVELDRLSGWEEIGDRLRAEARPDDLVVLLSARRGTISWHPALARLPGLLGDLSPESFLVVYPSEAEGMDGREGGQSTLPIALAPENVVVGVPATDHSQAITTILGSAFNGDRQRLHELTARLVRHEEEFTTEIQPGVVVPHVRVADLPKSMIFLGISPDGVRFPHAEAPAHLIFVVLTPEDPPQEHLRQLADVARMVSNPTRVVALREAHSLQQVLEILSGGP